LALSVPLSRFTSRVGGGSAFYVRQQYNTTKQHEPKMKNNTLKHLVILAVSICGAASLLAQQNYANTHINNASGKPIGLMDITDGSGKAIATLFITGKEASFDSNQKIFKGAGYIQAVTNQYIHIVFTIKHQKKGEKDVNYSQMQLGVNRIDWDDDGKTTHISGINPTIEAMFSDGFKITSDLKTPSLTNGVLNVDIEKQGKVSLEIKFGDKGTVLGDKIFDF
jgi:hypothetical protein